MTTLLVTYDYRGTGQATELEKPEPFSFTRLALDIAGRLGSTDGEDVTRICIMSETPKRALELAQEHRSNPFAWTVHLDDSSTEQTLLTLWSGEKIISRIFTGSLSQARNIAEMWRFEIMQARDTFAETRRRIVQAMSEEPNPMPAFRRQSEAPNQTPEILR